jgi:Protein of unknown function (DUF3224)
MTNTYEATKWEENNYAETEDGVKLAYAKVSYKYGGQLDGEGNASGLLTYLPGGAGTFVSSELFTGRLNGKQGTVVLHCAGDFDAEHITGTWTIAPGSGTGELAGATGEGSFDMKMGVSATEYTFTR